MTPLRKGISTRMTDDRRPTTDPEAGRESKGTRPGIPIASEFAELDELGSVDVLDSSEDAEVWRLLDETMLVYEGELASSEDPRVRMGLAYELGRLFESVRGDQPRAAQLYQRALSSNPTHLPSISKPLAKSFTITINPSYPIFKSEMATDHYRNGLLVTGGELLRPVG